MRTWFVHPAYLCRQRVLGQHREIHMLAAAIQKKKMQSHPLTKFWQEKANWNAVVLYHDLIVLEMNKRGMIGHKTPLLIDDNDRTIKLPLIKNHYLTRDIEDLLNRWERHGQHGKPRLEIPDRAITVPHVFSNLEKDINETDFMRNLNKDFSNVSVGFKVLSV